MGERAAISRLVNLALVTLALAVPAMAKTPAVRPVMVGGQAGLDACPSVGEITPLRKGGDGYVSVRAAPSVKARELDRVRPGRRLMLCEDSADGKWVGVVYAEPWGGAAIEDCVVSRAAAGKPRPYEGFCLSGWVARRYVSLTAG